MNASRFHQVFGEGADFWGQHPTWPRDEWQSEVADGNTLLGYWDWVLARKEEADEEEKEEEVDINPSEPYPEGTKLVSLEPFQDDGPNSEERITPAGSVWTIRGGPDQDGDYEAVCEETGGWLFFEAEALVQRFKPYTEED